MFSTPLHPSSTSMISLSPMSPMSPMPGLSPGGISSPSTFLQREDESRNVLIIDGSHLIKGPKREKLPVFDVQNGMEKLIREIEVQCGFRFGKKLYFNSVRPEPELFIQNFHNSLKSLGITCELYTLKNMHLYCRDIACKCAHNIIHNKRSAGFPASTASSAAPTSSSSSSSASSASINPYASGAVPVVGEIQSGVDVAIATTLIQLACQNRLNRVCLISGDGDFRSAVRFVAQFLGKSVYCVGFKDSLSTDLLQYATNKIYLNDIWHKVCFYKDKDREAAELFHGGTANNNNSGSPMHMHAHTRMGMGMGVGMGMGMGMGMGRGMHAKMPMSMPMPMPMPGNMPSRMNTGSSMGQRMAVRGPQSAPYTNQASSGTPSPFPYNSSNNGDKGNTRAPLHTSGSIGLTSNNGTSTGHHISNISNRGNSSSNSNSNNSSSSNMTNNNFSAHQRPPAVMLQRYSSPHNTQNQNHNHHSTLPPPHMRGNHHRVSSTSSSSSSSSSTSSVSSVLTSPFATPSSSYHQHNSASQYHNKHRGERRLEKCYFWSTKGYCNRGDACSFAHPPAPTTSASASASASSASTSSTSISTPTSLLSPSPSPSFSSAVLMTPRPNHHRIISHPTESPGLKRKRSDSSGSQRKSTDESGGASDGETASAKEEGKEKEKKSKQEKKMKKSRKSKKLKRGGDDGEGEGEGQEDEASTKEKKRKGKKDKKAKKDRKEKKDKKGESARASISAMVKSESKGLAALRDKMTTFSALVVEEKVTRREKGKKSKKAKKSKKKEKKSTGPE